MLYLDTQKKAGSLVYNVVAVWSPDSIWEECNELITEPLWDTVMVGEWMGGWLSSWVAVKDTPTLP